MADKPVTRIEELLYFDIEKASSLLSQFEGGFPQETKVGEESSKDKKSIKGGSLKFIKLQYEGIEAEKMSALQTKVLHHDLLDRVESLLFENNMAFILLPIKNEV